MLLHNPFGPIFEKELRATSRRKRTYVLRVVYLGALLLFLVMAYGAAGGFDDRDWGGGAGVARRVRAQNELGRTFFICFSMFCVGAMAMIGPVLTSTAISAERLHKTLHVLLMTPITSWQIVTGKLFSRLLVALTLIGLSLPVLALVRLLGGVEVSQMFAVVTLCAVTAVVTAAMGLFVSTFVNRAYAAILLGYAAILVLYVAVPGLVMVGSAGRGAPRWEAIQFASIISPFFATGIVVSPMGVMSMAPWWWCAALQMGIAAALVACSAAMLRRVQRREGGGASGAQVQGTPAEAGSPPSIEYGRSDDAGMVALQTTQTKRAVRKRSRRDVGDNPVLWRELGRPLFPRRWQSWTASAVTVTLLCISYACFASAQILAEKELQILYAVGFNGVAWLVLGVLSATAIATEKESDTWTLLLATPVAGRAIVVGKILGLYRRTLWPYLLVAAHFALFALFDVISWVTAAYVTWIIFSFNAVWVASGVYLSLRLRKVTFAVIVNLSIALVLYIAVPVMLIILTELLDADEQFLERLFWLLSYFHLVQGVIEFSPAYDPSDTFYPTGSDSMPVRVLLYGGLIVGAGHLLVAGAIAWYTVNRFNRIVGRAEQRVPLRRGPIEVRPLPVSA